MAPPKTRTRDTGYRLAGWAITQDEPGDPTICWFCLHSPDIDHDQASRALEESESPEEILKNWDAAFDRSKLIAWRRLLDISAFGAPTHDIVTVHVQWKRHRPGKVTALAVQDRTPAWFVPESAAYTYRESVGMSPFYDSIEHNGVADAYVTAEARTEAYKTPDPKFWVDWDWPLCPGWPKQTADSLFVLNLRSPAIFAVTRGGCPEVRQVGRWGSRDQVLASGVYLQSSSKQRRTDSVGWKFLQSRAIAALLEPG